MSDKNWHTIWENFSLVATPEQTIGKGTSYTDNLQPKLTVDRQPNKPGKGDDGQNRKIKLSKNSANAKYNFRILIWEKSQRYSLVHQSPNQNDGEK